MRSIWCIVMLWSTEIVLSARILGVFPIPSISHQVVFRALTQELARRGHELVLLTTDPVSSHPNITEIDAHDISYRIWQQQAMSKIFEAERNGQRSVINQYSIFSDALIKIMDSQLSLPEVQDLLSSGQDNHFDLILVESHARPMFAFRHRFNAPLVAVSSLSATAYTLRSMGIPTHPIIYPDPMSVKVSNHTIYDKIVAAYHYLHILYLDSKNLYTFNEMVRNHFGEDTPDITDLESETDLLILNIHPIWDGIKVTSPNVIYMSGIHQNPPKPLPEDLKKFLDGSSRGVVYMSLGSNMKSSELSADRLHVLVEAFRQLPYDVLWKWETDELPSRPDNVRIAKWLPQADLLRHENVRAFITQGGLQSTDEALRAGVPLIGIPMFADQESNVQKYVQHGVGVEMNIKTLTVDQLVNAVETVVKDETYRTAVRSMARLMADGDVAGGVKRAAWWVEYVLRHGGAQHLRSPAAGVSTAEYYMLDVFAVLGLSTTIGMIVILSLLNCLLSNLKFSLRIGKLKKQ